MAPHYDMKTTEALVAAFQIFKDSINATSDNARINAVVLHDICAQILIAVPFPGIDTVLELGPDSFLWEDEKFRSEYAARHNSLAARLVQTLRKMTTEIDQDEYENLLLIAIQTAEEMRYWFDPEWRENNFFSLYL